MIPAVTPNCPQPPSRRRPYPQNAARHPADDRRRLTFARVRSPDPTAERTIAESRLRSIIAPARRPYARRHARPSTRQAETPTPSARNHHDRTPHREPDDWHIPHTADPSKAWPVPDTDDPREAWAPSTRAREARNTPGIGNPREEAPHTPNMRALRDVVTADSPDNAPPPPPPSPHQETARPVPLPPTFQAFRKALASQAPALDPGKPGLRVLLAVAALAVAVAAFLAWRSQPSPEPLPPPTPISSAPPSPAASTTASTKVTVHVAGKIRNPGVYLLPSGSRVTDAVTAAGGVSRGASTGALNLARRLIDGEQIVVGPSTGSAPPGTPVLDPATAILDLNSATPDQLEELPGVGEVLAARIAEFRTSHGGFTSVEQLREVNGIGPRKFDEIKAKVRV